MKFSINFLDGGRSHIDTSPLICSTNQWTGFYMITASVMKELRIWSDLLKKPSMENFFFCSVSHNPARTLELPYKE